MLYKAYKTRSEWMKNQKNIDTVGNQCQIGLGTNYVYKIYKIAVKIEYFKLHDNNNTNTIQKTQNGGNNNYKKKKKQFVFLVKKLI